MINTLKGTNYTSGEQSGREVVASTVFVGLVFCVSLFKEGTGDKVRHVFVLRGKLFLLFYDWRHLLQECKTDR